MSETNQIYVGDCVEVMRDKIADNSIDLTVTSPPYDNLRKYNGYAFDFESVAEELYRVTKQGGVVVWVVGDATVKGSETGTSFRQALHFMDVGFRLHDTMIFEKQNPVPQFKTKRYTNAFEYMFILTKGKPATCNYLTEPSKTAGRKINRNGKSAFAMQSADRPRDEVTETKSEKILTNVWKIPVGSFVSDKYAKEHPATFPEKLAEDHIISWSNPGDTVLDPFGGSGTTAKMSALNGRDSIYIDMSDEYAEIARKRIEDACEQLV